jgi:hypothetical protein
LENRLRERFSIDGLGRATGTLLKVVRKAGSDDIAVFTPRKIKMSKAGGVNITDSKGGVGRG